MKKFMVMLMILAVMCASSYGAETADTEIYVRKEVFNAYMDSINSKFDAIMREMKQMREEMREEINGIKEELKAQREEIKQVKEEMRSEIKSLRQDISNIVASIAVMSQRIDNLEARMSDLRKDSNSRNNIPLWLVVLGIVFALPSVQKFLEWRDSRRPSITLEDVKRLIEESKSEARNA